MKATPEERQRITDAVRQFDTPEVRQAYRDGKFPRADRVKNLDMRYRWDLFWAARAAKTEMGDLSHLNDNHIDTVLRSAVPTLEG